MITKVQGTSVTFMPETAFVPARIYPFSFSDTLCSSCPTRGFLCFVVQKIVLFARALIEGSMNFLGRVFCCLSSSPLSILEVYEQNVTFIGKLALEFAHRRKTLTEPALKKWWYQQFYHLDPKIQKLLLLEDLILRAHGVEDKRKWAEKNFVQHRTLVTEFVVNLNEETIGGKTYRPSQDVPKLLESLHTYLSIEIDRLLQE